VKDDSQLMAAARIDCDLTGEIASHKVTHMDREASVREACKLMRSSGVSDLLVTGHANGTFLAYGVVTASDIVTRVVAMGLDLDVVTVGDIAWSRTAAPS
jgi:predicted transcriptional regulator